MRHPTVFRSLLITGLFALSAPLFAATSISELPALRDQFGQITTATPGDVRVAIVVSAKRLRRIKPWEKALRKEFPELIPIRVADIPRDAPVEYESVAEKLRRRVPENISVGIDLHGEWANTLGLDTSVPNIMIFDATGDLVHTTSAMYKTSRYESLRAALINALGQDDSTAPGD